MKCRLLCAVFAALLLGAGLGACVQPVADDGSYSRSGPGGRD